MNNITYLFKDFSLLRKGVESELESLGITGQAAEILMKIDAPRRREARVVEFMEKLYKEVAILMQTQDTYVVNSFCALLCYADGVGVGGFQDIEGLSTSRVPLIAKAIPGTGRKNASDGGAGDDVVSEALARFTREIGMHEDYLYFWGSADSTIQFIFSSLDLCSFSPEALLEEIAFLDAENWVSTEEANKLLPLRWQRALAYQGLDQNFEQAVSKGQRQKSHYLGGVKEWSEIFNEIEARIALHCNLHI